jgi:hypothetical protein
MSTVRCALCGCEVPEAQAVRLFTGRPRYVCLSCYAQGDRQVRQRLMDISRTRRMEKINAKNK